MEATQQQPSSGSGEAQSAETGDKVVCFVSKRKVDRSQAKQIRHPKEGLVWVSEEFIK